MYIAYLITITLLTINLIYLFCFYNYNTTHPNICQVFFRDFLTKWGSCSHWE
nr:MAG TPA: hypothetical protein [Caudoviricetes sp.]